LDSISGYYEQHTDTKLPLQSKPNERFLVYQMIADLVSDVDLPL